MTTRADSGKTLGDITRGTTNPNRLRRVDRWMLHAVCPIIRASADPLLVDLGYGASPITTVELFDRAKKHVRDDVEVIGIEIDPVRVAEAQPHARENLSFIFGGFEIPLPHARQPIMIRAFNVLRQYEEKEVRESWRAMTYRLAPGGVLAEGTCDEIGRRSCWVTLDARTDLPKTLTISMHLDSLELPSDIAPRLPKILIHRNVPGEKIHSFLQAMDHEWKVAAGMSSFGARARWLATIESLVAQGYPIADSKTRWRLGEITIPWELVG